MDGLGGWCGSDVWQVMLFHNYCTLTIWFKSLLYVVKWSMSLFSFYFQWVILFSVCKWSNFCVVCFWFLGWCLIFIRHFVFAQEQHNLQICCLNFDPPWSSCYKSWYKCLNLLHACGNEPTHLSTCLSSSCFLSKAWVSNAALVLPQMQNMMYVSSLCLKVTDARLCKQWCQC